MAVGYVINITGTIIISIIRNAYDLDKLTALCLCGESVNQLTNYQIYTNSHEPLDRLYSIQKFKIVMLTDSNLHMATLSPKCTRVNLIIFTSETKEYRRASIFLAETNLYL